MSEFLEVSPDCDQTTATDAAAAGHTADVQVRDVGALVGSVY